jgi:hypothetical protein
VTGAVNVTIENGYLRVIGEIPVTSGKEGIEGFLSEISLQLFGSKKKPKAPSFGLAKRELTEGEAAVYIGRSKSFLRKCRAAGRAGTLQRGPKYTRDSERCIRYPISELDKWLASRAIYEANCEVVQDA